MIVWAFCAVAAGKSATIVYINGAKYYIHTVQAGETLYGLSKTYGVGEKVILENNPSIARGLKTAENIKIPFVADVPEPKSDKKLRKTFDFHFVSKGETLYAISKRYGISVETLLEDMDTTMARCAPMTPERMAERPFWRRAMGTVLRLFAMWM